MGLLHQAGYRRAVDYAGGLEDWRSQGRLLEGAGGDPPRASAARRAGRRRSALLGRAIDGLEGASPRTLARTAVLSVLGFALAYLLLCFWPGHGLMLQGEPVHWSVDGARTAVYFSVATATTLGYGDVVPVGFARGLAMVEAVGGLLLFGAVLAKFLSRRQEALVAEIAQLTFEDRLGRLQSGLHLVIGDLIELGDACRVAGADPVRLGPRFESSVLVFSSHLRGMYDLLFRPKDDLDEDVLDALLAALVAALSELQGMLGCESLRAARTPELEHRLGRVSRLAESICGDCVPHEYAEPLQARMDRVRDLARQL